MNKSLELMMENENSLAKLYKNFSQKYTEYSDFWLRLSDDERSHEKWLGDLSSQAEAGKIKINTSRFNAEEAKRFGQRIDELAKKYEEKQGDIVYALGIALELEKNLTDKKYFDCCDVDDRELQFALNDLRESSEKHKERVEKMLSKLKEKK